jgi:hypothetical protein
MKTAYVALEVEVNHLKKLEELMKASQKPPKSVVIFLNFAGILNPVSIVD